jgi:hypothetical protein
MRRIRNIMPGKITDPKLIEHIIERALNLIKTTTSADIAMVAARAPKAQLDGYKGRGLKQKGGAAPVDYTATEAFVDLEAELRLSPENRDIQLIVTNYLFLSRLVGEVPPEK